MLDAQSLQLKKKKGLARAHKFADFIVVTIYVKGHVSVGVGQRSRPVKCGERGTPKALGTRVLLP